MSSDRLSELRQRVRELTVDIVRLTSERFRLVRSISEEKRALNLPIEDLDAERALKHHICRSTSQGELDADPDFALRITNLLIDESIKLQRGDGTQAGRTTTEFFTRALQLEREGHRVFHLELGEPDFELAPELVDSVVKALKEGRHKYTDPRGLYEVREAICRHLEESKGADVKPDEVLFTAGGRMALAWGIGAVVPPGGEVVVIEPAWPGYRQAVEFFGGKYVPVRTSSSDGWTPKLEEVRSAISPCTRAIVVNSPSNPTGRVVDEEELRDIAKLAKEKGLWLISDEVYSDFVYDGKFKSAFGLDCKLIYVGSFSKSLGMTGFRAGYLVASKEVISKALKFQTATLTCAPEFVQLACCEALRLKNYVARNFEVMRARVELSNKELSRARELEFLKPQGGFYVFPRFRDGRDAEAFASGLLSKEHVSVTPGVTFGEYRDCFRISLCTRTEDLLEGLMRMRAFIESAARNAGANTR
jgi:aspartate aminotransferase